MNLQNVKSEIKKSPGAKTMIFGFLFILFALPADIEPLYLSPNLNHNELDQSLQFPAITPIAYAKNEAKPQADLLQNRRNVQNLNFGEHLNLISPDKHPDLGLDLDRLAYAVSWAETSNCQKGTGIKYNNCFGIRRNGAFVRYTTTADSFQDFKQIFTK